jgi:hypothetical protein
MAHLQFHFLGAPPRWKAPTMRNAISRYRAQQKKARLEKAHYTSPLTTPKHLLYLEARKENFTKPEWYQHHESRTGDIYQPQLLVR